MDNTFENLKRSWSQAKTEQASHANSEDMLIKAQKSQAYAKQQHLLNILVLALVVVGLAAFFYFIAPLQDTLSHFGITFMIGGLLIRILIETVSHSKARKLDYSNSSLDLAKMTRMFYKWRKRIHGPVTFAIVLLYSIGFYMLTPEFSRYFEPFWIYLMDIGYLIILVILFLVIRKGVLKELAHLKHLNEVVKDL